MPPSVEIHAAYKCGMDALICMRIRNALLRFGEKHSFAVQLSRRLDQLAQYQSTNGDIPEKLYME